MLRTHAPPVHVTPTPETICAVVVTYHPDEEFESRFRVLIGQVAGAIIVDNHSNPTALTRLRECASRYLGVRLIENSENLGIATALNLGTREAVNDGFAWVLTLDQDTTPHSDMVAILIHAWTRHPARHRVAQMGTQPAESAGGGGQGGRHTADTTGVRFVVTAGALVANVAFEHVGPYRDDYFIDSVDREYSLRLRAYGYLVELATHCGMTHVWGEPEVRRIGPIRATCSSHSPLRRYYITRNWLVALAPHLHREPGTCLAEFASLLIDTVKAVTLERDRGEKIRAVAAGVRDAAFGRLGQRAWPAGGG